MPVRQVLAVGTVVVATVASGIASAQAPSLPPAYALKPIDREFIAGVSYRDAIGGSLVLVSAAWVAGLLTGYTVTSAAVIVSVAGTYLLFEPSFVPTPSKVDVPTLPELERKRRDN